MQMISNWQHNRSQAERAPPKSRHRKTFNAKTNTRANLITNGAGSSRGLEQLRVQERRGDLLQHKNFN